MSRLDQAQKILDLLHRQVGQALRHASLVLGVGMILGCLFTMLLIPVFALHQSPQTVLKTRTFEVNYTASLRLNDRKTAGDPTWDGTLAGMSAGYVYLKSIPVIGVVIGPALGGMVGYKLDSRI